MFFYESIPWYSWVAFLVVLAALIGLNEVTRRWKIGGLAFFVALPIILTIFVWPNTATGATGTWFHWVKVYSALAGSLGFMLIRYNRKLALNKWVLVFPPAILAINIFEACVRDFEIGGLGLNGMHDGVWMISGSWNYMNGIAGIINAITICGWFGIIISRDKSKDMIWPDMLWFWIIAYDLWNFAYVYNCVGDHSFYAGFGLLAACTIPAFLIKRGAWLQHRANTLALWMMFTMAFPYFVGDSMFAVETSRNPHALFWLSFVALAFNIGVLVYQAYTIFKYRLNPLVDQLYTRLPGFQSVYNDNVTEADRLDGVYVRMMQERDAKKVSEVEAGKKDVDLVS